MDIIFCADKKYARFLPTVLNSISIYNDMSEIRFHLLHNIKNKNIIDNYKTYVNKKYGSRLVTYFISKKFKYKNNLDHVTHATMFRLLIPKIVDVYGQALYLDLDVIVNVNLKKVLSLGFGSKGISGKTSVRDNVIENMSYRNIKPTYKTLNAGVLIMNLELLRKDKFTEKCLNLMQKHPYNDQVIINLYLEGEYKELPKQYNIFNTQDDKLLSKHKEFILHYIGPYKPWNYKVPNMDIWKRSETYVL